MAEVRRQLENSEERESLPVETVTRGLTEENKCVLYFQSVFNSDTNN
jgi:hypothetical protein